MAWEWLEARFHAHRARNGSSGAACAFKLGDAAQVWLTPSLPPGPVRVNAPRFQARASAIERPQGRLGRRSRSRLTSQIATCRAGARGSGAPGGRITLGRRKMRRRQSKRLSPPASLPPVVVHWSPPRPLLASVWPARMPPWIENLPFSAQLRVRSGGLTQAAAAPMLRPRLPPSMASGRRRWALQRAQTVAQTPLMGAVGPEGRWAAWVRRPRIFPPIFSHRRKQGARTAAPGAALSLELHSLTKEHQNI